MSTEAGRWMKQATEDLAAAGHLADDPELPPRLVAFLAHLAAEKALKSALIFRERPVRRIHDLVALQAALPDEDAASLDPDDVDLLLPWNIAGRYPADVPDAEPGIAATALAAAGRIVDVLRARTVGTSGPEETEQADRHADAQARVRADALGGAEGDVRAVRDEDIRLVDDNASRQAQDG